MLTQSTLPFDSLQPSALDDFYQRVHRPRDPDACWLWQGRSFTGDGYGQIMRGRRRYMVHRYSYLLHYGYLPDDKVVMHSCDVPRCVNPRHLRLGTQADNMHDRDRKGRGTNFVPKLTDEQVAEIRRLRAAGVPQSVVAQRFGVRQPTISYIDNGRIQNGTPRGRPRTAVPKLVHVSSVVQPATGSSVMDRAVADIRRFHQMRDGRVRQRQST